MKYPHPSSLKQEVEELSVLEERQSQKHSHFHFCLYFKKREENEFIRTAFIHDCSGAGLQEEKRQRGLMWRKNPQHPSSV